MGFLLFAGLIGSALYTSHVAKKEIESTIIDSQTEATLNSEKNKEKIKDNFLYICKRCNIKTIDNKPTSNKNINIAIEYLKHQGYNDNDIQYFKKLFNDKLYQNQSQTINDIKTKHKDLLNMAKNNTKQQKIILRKHIYNSELSPQERIDKLLENRLWHEIVHHQSYIKSDAGSWEEIWTLYVPYKFFWHTTKQELYREVCRVQGVRYSL